MCNTNRRLNPFRQLPKVIFKAHSQWQLFRCKDKPSGFVINGHMPMIRLSQLLEALKPLPIPTLLITWDSLR